MKSLRVAIYEVHILCEGEDTTGPKLKKWQCCHRDLAQFWRRVERSYRKWWEQTACHQRPPNPDSTDTRALKMPALCSFTAEMIEFIRSRIQMGDKCHRHGDKWWWYGVAEYLRHLGMTSLTLSLGHTYNLYFFQFPLNKFHTVSYCYFLMLENQTQDLVQASHPWAIFSDPSLIILTARVRNVCVCVFTCMYVW